MYEINRGTTYTELPELIFTKSNRRVTENGIKTDKKYQKAVMDAFENIAWEQFCYNLKEFQDFYMMYDGTLSHKEFKMMAPQFEHFSDLLDKAELPSYVSHWDILGAIINTLVGKLIMMQDRFVPTDTGEVAENEFTTELNKQLQSSLVQVIENMVRIGFAERGINPENMEPFSTPEEQQQYQQFLEQERRKIVPEHTERLAQTAKYKTQGVIWAEATLEKDKEILDFDKQYKELFKQYLLSGVCAKVVKVVYDTYRPFVWDSRSVFHSKDFGKVYLQDFQYAGRIYYQTPSQVIQEYGMSIDTKTQEELLEGDQTWKKLQEIKTPTGGFREVLNKNFNKSVTVPYVGYDNMLFYRHLQDLTGAPMGDALGYNEEGHLMANPDFIQNNGLNSFYRWGAKYMEDRFPLPKEACQVTEVYFKAMEYVGWLTYETEYGDQRTVEVKQDLLDEYIKENNIKVKYTLSWNEMMKDFPPNSLVWQLRPVTCWGVKICAWNKVEPIYLGVEPMDVQIKGDHEFDRKLPVTGLVGRSLAKKISPYQEMFNYAWNSMRQLLEKELGSFFLMGLENIPSEYSGSGDAQEAMINLRNYAKNIGLMAVATNAENRNPTVFNQFSVQTLSHANEIETRYLLANRSKQEAYLVIGVNPAEGIQPTQYATQMGIQVSQEAMQQQIAYIYEDFNGFIKNDHIHHLSVAQYAQSNNMDKSLYYTKSDASIAFLRMTDPLLPLRNLGITVTDNNKKRKELEAIRQYLISQGNTMGMDTMEFAKVMTSDTMRELLHIAAEERALRQEREALQQQNTMQQIQATQQGEAQREQANWEREEVTNERNRKNKLDVETIQAYGRAADKDANAEDFNRIMQAADSFRKDLDSEASRNARLEDIKLRQEELNFRKSQITNSDEFKRMEYDLKNKKIEADKYIATINKN